MLHEMAVLLELEAAEPLSPYADGLALQLAGHGTVFVPRPPIDPRSRSLVVSPTGIVVRLESRDAEPVIADWLTATAGCLGSGSISGRVADRHRTFTTGERTTAETLRFLIEGE